MVGHTGDFSAVIKAVETVDGFSALEIETFEEDYQIFLTADHGNADFMINVDGSPNTAHNEPCSGMVNCAKTIPCPYMMDHSVILLLG